MMRFGNAGNWSPTKYVTSSFKASDEYFESEPNDSEETKKIVQYFIQYKEPTPKVEKEKPKPAPSEPKKPAPKPSKPKVEETKSEPEKCPRQFYRGSDGECTQTTCEDGWEVLDSGRACGIICDEYFYRAADLKTCKQKECTGVMTVHESGRFCVRKESSQFEIDEESLEIDLLENQIISDESCGGHYLNGKELEEYGKKVNSVLNSVNQCNSAYETKIDRFTSTPPSGYRFVWVDEFLHDDKFKAKFTSLIKNNKYGAVALINGKISGSTVSEECQNDGSKYVALVSDCKAPGLG